MIKQILWVTRLYSSFNDYKIVTVQHVTKMLIDSLLYTTVFYYIYFLLITAANLRPAIIGGAGVPHVCAVDVAEVAGVAVAIVDGDLPSREAAAVLL